MTREARCAAWVGSLMLGMARVTEGQEASRLRLAVHASASSDSVPLDLSSPRAAVVSDGQHRHPILRGAGIGALVGVGAGLVYAVYLNASNECKQPAGYCTKDEAGLAFLVLPIYGVFFGSIAGAVAGAILR